MVVLVAGMAACEKGERVDDLSHCERCTYTFREDTDAGSLIFAYRNYFLEGRIGNNSTPHYELAIAVPAGANTFSYSDEEIASDHVNYSVMCMNCGTVPVETVGGTIKGRKINDRKWLLDANVYLESPTHGRDTLVFKQFFTK